MAWFPHLAASLRRCELFRGNVSAGRACFRESCRAGGSLTQLPVCGEHCWLDVGNIGGGLHFDGLFIRIPDIDTASAGRSFLCRRSVCCFGPPICPIATRSRGCCYGDVPDDCHHPASVPDVV